MNVRHALKQLSARGFGALDRAGLHVLPKHYYTPVADRAWLRAHRDLWQRPLDLDWDLDCQLDWLRETCGPYYDEVAGLDAYERLAAGGFGPGYGPIESQVLHCFVRAHAPARIVEVGGGVTTAIMARASAGLRITTVEPAPHPALRALEGVELLATPVQDAPPELFAELGDGDLLFVDSSHAVKTGSEVPYVYLELVPNLAPGVFVHVHDVYLPYLYSPLVLEEYFDPQESTLIAALLTGNERLEILCCESALHHERPAELREILRDYRPLPTRDGLTERGARGHFPSSLWLRTR